MLLKNATLEWVYVTRVNTMAQAYTIDAFLSVEEAKPVTDAIDAAWAAHSAGKSIKPQSLGYTLTDDGRVKFKFKQAPKSPDGQYEFEIDVYDAEVNKLERSDIPQIGNGSIGDISFEIFPYTFKANKGIKLTPKALKLIKLEEYKGGGNSADDFTAETGYIAPVKENPFAEEPKASLDVGV